jgi:4-carboxymuconolactone decarboxylase
MSDAYENGLAMRRKVMGDAFVDRALANATEFTEPLQRIITENAWGTVWCRGGTTSRRAASSPLRC